MADSLGSIRGQIRLDVRQAVAAYATVRAQNQRTVYALRGTGDAFVSAGQTMAVAGGAMVYGFAKVVNAAAEFERKMDYASAVSGTTGEKMEQLSDYALKLGQDTIYSAGQIADGFIELAKAGVSAEQIIGGIGEAMANLGAAGDIPLAQSGQIITSTIQQFDLAASDAVKVTDLLAGAANASIADISDIGVSLKYVGGVANAAGLKFEDTAVAISLLAKAGIRGSTAGTSLRQMVVSLGGATGPARSALKELGILAEDGSNKFFTAEGKTKSLSQVFQILQDSTADLTQKQRLMYLRTIFNNRALSAASILTRDGAAGFREMNKEMSKVTAAEVASQRLDNLSGDIEILKGNLETLFIKGGSPFQEMLRGWVQKLTELVQAFADLEPSTQKLIFQTMGIVGAALVLMGTFTMVIGMIFRFLAAAKKFWAGLGFLARIIRIVWTNLRWLGAILSGPVVAAFGSLAAAIGVSAGVLLAIIAAVVLLVGGLVLAYKKVDWFRNAVNAVASALWTGIKAIGAFFAALVTDPGKAWAMLKTLFGNLGSLMGKLGSLIWVGLQKGLGYIAKFSAMAVKWIASLPGKIIGLLVSLTTKMAEIFTFKNVGYAIGFMIGTVIRLFVLLGAKIFAHVGNMVTGVLSFFQALPSKVGYALGFLLGTIIRLLINLGTKMNLVVGNAVNAVVNFFKTLPNRVGAFMSRMATRAVIALIRLAVNLPNLASRAVEGILNFFRTLPVRSAVFFANMIAKAKTLLNRMKNNMINMGQEMARGLLDGIRGLPESVRGIFDRVVSAIKDKITSAYNSVKDFSKGMWDGFKDGLGINSPSLIEKQMYQINDVTRKEMGTLGRHIYGIQSASKKLARVNFGVGDSNASRGLAGYARLASSHANNLKRARTITDTPGDRAFITSPDARKAIAKGTGKRTLKMKITNWEEGTGYFYDLAQDAVEDDNDYQDSLGRM